MMYMGLGLMRPDRVIRTSVIEPFSLDKDPVMVARAQLARWTAIAQQTSVPGYGPPTGGGMRGLGNPYPTIVSRAPQPDIRSAGPRVYYPGVRALPVSARDMTHMPSLAVAMGVATRLSLLLGAKQSALLHRLSYAYAHKGQGREAGVLRAILRLVPVRGNNIQMTASLLTQFSGGDLALVNAAVAQAGREG